MPTTLKLISNSHLDRGKLDKFLVVSLGGATGFATAIREESKENVEKKRKTNALILCEN